MKVHFACSTSELNKYAKNYLAICQNIKDLGHKITREWIEEGIKINKQRETEIDREDIYKKSVESILTSDVVVVEGSIPSFGVGHQITIAINRNKPILFLVYKKAEGSEKKFFRNSFINGIKSPLLETVTYDFDNIKEILEDFFNQNKRGAIIKFNIVLTKEIDNYLDWASFTYKKNKSKYIRDIIQKHMNENDKKYQKYLKHGLS